MDKTLNESEENMDFTLADYYKERIHHHWKMLYYYLNQKK